jgi:hypothetical protein
MLIKNKLRKRKEGDMVFNVKKTLGYSLFSRFADFRSLFLMLFFDALFFATLYAAATLFDSFFVSYQSFLIGTWQGSLSLFLYFLAVIFSYSFFKLIILHFLGQKKLVFSRLKDFFFYNIVMLFVLLGLFVFGLGFVTIALDTVFKAAIFQVFVIGFGLCAYVFIQISHVLFFSRGKILLRHIPKYVFGVDKLELGKWFLWNVVYAAGFGLLFFLIGTFMEYAGQQAIGSEGWYGVFFALNIVILVYLFVVAYFFVVWNRFYLYALVSNEKL